MYTVASVGCYDLKDVPLKSINMQNKQHRTTQEAAEPSECSLHWYI